MMTDWSSDLGAALASGDPEFMKAMLVRVPKEVLKRAVPYLDHLAATSAKDGKLEESLTYYDHLIEVTPGYVDRHADRARVLLKLSRFADALADAERIIEFAPTSAVGYRLQAEAYDGLHKLPNALAAFQRALCFKPDDEAIKQRIQSLETDIRKEAVLRQALDPAASQEPVHVELPPPPKVTFDPALFDDPAIPASFDSFRVEGLKQHLWRYSGQLSPGNAIARLEDPVWLDAWDAALATTAGSRVLFRGSELGVFGLRALQHGAEHVTCMEAFPLDARIATGMVQKQFLTRWHACHGAEIQGWSEEERSVSFEAFAGGIDIVSAGYQASSETRSDCFVFPQVDHTLLGTGIVKAIRQHLSQQVLGERAANARILPAKATVFAMGIQWNYPGESYRLEPMNDLRWSLYPQALNLGPEFWTALTEPVRVGEINFANFAETTWNAALPITSPGHIDAIVFWYDLELDAPRGNARISNAPGSALQCIKPAVQYTDPISVQLGSVVKMHVRVEESRLFFQTQPASTLRRAHGLPSWYVPMLGDSDRNNAYRTAITSTLASRPTDLVLDIGAGCGLLSMMAADAGAGRVVGCEMHPAFIKAGKEIVAINGLSDKIRLIEKDCRNLKVPEDLPQRAGLALFELFDCSLIGEGILHFLAYAREHLLAQNARYLPAAAKIRAMLVEYRIDRVWDIDANLLNPYRSSPAFINVDAAKLNYRALTEPFDVFAFDFATAGPAPEEKTFQLPAIAAGTASAVLFWFELRLNDDYWISNNPQCENTLHWKQGLQILPEARVEAGTNLPLIGRHDGSGLKFQWQLDGLPKEIFSKVPRFDPRWLAANSELEQQTQSLLQHCMQNPDEYAKVAEIAQRFAINPAAHGLDPSIAQRFASMFLNA